MQVPGVPGGDDWWERYGPIGIVAFLALSALVFLARNYFIERRAETDKRDREKAELQEMVTLQQKSLHDLNTKMVDVVQSNHRETLELLESQREDHEQRFQELLERHMAMSEKWVEKMQDITSVVGKAIESLSRKLRDGG